ncbi:FMN-linked oxidoreductase [Coniophora puteana RWD-64-598 SS2]|uniref:FMN-linked oxidoreductase n=1 Tax=Coniophora puteana (strain RWD-64-598) TaxID=741705 RepID=A0A5M3MLN9_CONPW|nr:FMN-linked oxidoreductase [Coniophora puteana RWD-64-598 SS2]EIW79890.1 FMN-linked oxidoreductase [Coniophora puteana RWD-64-598 SS2]
MAIEKTPALFSPFRVGEVDLKHRVVLAPLTRFRGYDDHTPGPLAAEYYAQRASMPGTLMIAEATFACAVGGGYANVPGIYTDAHIEGWKKVTDAIHAKGSYIYLQMWSLGRTADPKFLASEGFEFTAASDIPMKAYAEEGHPNPRPMTLAEVKEHVQLYATAAENAIKAGFDGVEIHSAHGYLIDQFLQDVSNNRTDEYGGSIENRSRFGLEVAAAVVKAIGASRVGIRLSAWSEFQDMRMKDPVPTYTYYVKELKKLNLSYMHVVEPRMNGNEDVEDATGSNEFIREIWGDSPFIVAGGYTRESALKTAEEKGVLIAFGRNYISNPDLPRRLLEDLPLTPPDRTKYYVPGSHTAEGYTDWPFAEETTKA